MASIRLLILDFDGVCTPSAAEHGCDEVVRELATRPEADDVVADAQRRGIVVAVLSNELDPAWIDELELLQTVDHVVNCADNRVFKPDRRAFQRCTLLTGARADETLVVDDQPDNVAVAQSLGMMAVLFDPSDAATSWAAVAAAMAS